MSGDTRPVGMFDSGVGGLTVLAEITAQHPHESVVYVADQRWAPYGDRNLEEVRVRSAQVAGQLVDTGAKLVVVALTAHRSPRCITCATCTRGTHLWVSSPR